MAKNNMVLLLWILIINLNQNAVTSSGDDPFHEFVHHIVGENAGREYLILEDINKVVTGMKSRLPEHEDIQKLTAVSVYQEVNLPFLETTQIQESEFGNMARFIIKTILPSGVPSTTEVSKTNVKDVLHHVSSNHYEGVEDGNNKCFNENTVMSVTSTTEYGEVFTEVLYNMYIGKCIYPDADDLGNLLKEALGVTTGADKINKAEFEKLLARLNISSATGGGQVVNHADEHNHKRKRRSTDEHEHEVNRCLQADGFYAVFDVQDKVTWTQFTELSSVLIQQLYTNSCVAATTAANNTNSTDSQYADAMKYGYGTAAVLIISCLALIGILMFPLIGRSAYEAVMQFFVALGVSALLSDALLHMIPFVVGIHVHDPSQEHAHSDEEESYEFVWKLSLTMLGIWVFFLFECLLRIFHGSVKGSKVSVLSNNREMEKGSNNVALENVSTDIDFNTNNFATGGVEDKKEINKNGDVPQVIIANEEPVVNDVCLGLSPICLMIFCGDVLHNFGDGIAIGVAFSISVSSGIGTSLAIFCHELPHEFGDFALYLSHGASKLKAILLNLFAALCALIGLYLGVGVAKDTAIRQWMLALIAGMFIYISLVDVMHEIIHDVISRPKYIFGIQNLGLLLGWTMLLLIALYEEDLEGVVKTNSTG